MRSDPAPIGMTVYSRLQHIQQTVEALRRNTLAAESELFIFSDAAKPGDEDKVAAVRAWLPTIEGFCKLHIIERTQNDRFRNNQEGRKLLLDEYGRFIFLEEDIVTTPSFLDFMNDALVRYRDDSRVFAINGYTPPLAVPADYPHPVLLLPRFAAWGFAIWKEKFDEIIMDITPEMYRVIRTDKQKLTDYCVGGDDAITQLWLQAHGYINALDVRIDYTMFVKGPRYVVCPTHSLACTTGCDGSGEHWVKETSKYDVRLGDYHGLTGGEGAQPDEHILNELKRFYALTPKGKLAYMAMDTGLYPHWQKAKAVLKKMRKEGRA